MLWRMSADTHEQRIGIMSTTPDFFAHLEPTTSLSATKDLWRGLRLPAMAKWVAETAQTPHGRYVRHSRRGSGIAEPPAGKATRRLLQELQVLPHEVATDALGIGVDQLPGDRTRRLAVGDRPPVEALDRQDAEAGRGQEHLLGVGRVEQVDIARGATDAELLGHVGGHLPADARQDIALRWREELALARDEDVAAQPLGPVAGLVEQDR